MSATEQTTEKPLVGITLGDFNGVGPEIILKTLSDPRILRICTPIIYGSNKIFSRYKKILTLQEDIHFFQARTVNEINPKKINLINCWEEDFEVIPGKVTPEAGKAAFLALEKATGDLSAKKLDALVTAPVNKKNMQQEGFTFPGHTEYLGSRLQGDPLMMMVAESLRVALVTAHISVREVSISLSADKITKKLNAFYRSLKNDFQITKPKIAVLGLNPHAGEEGLLGTEENEIIIPLIEDLKQKGLLIFGPYPADAFFGNHLYKKYDGVLAMYHDQGLIPFKTIAFETGVNFTAGIGAIRTSPDHGTAYDIAGKNKADESSFRHALYLAIELIKYRKAVPV